MEDILDFWFPNDKFQRFWFDKTKDKYIINAGRVVTPMLVKEYKYSPAEENWNGLRKKGIN